jgi:hypothetical protein
VLADLPGVQSLGRVKDAVGQPGVAVALTGNYRHCGEYSGQTASGGTTTVSRLASCVVEQRLVIDPHTWLPLAQELRYQKLPDGQKWTGPDGLFSFQLFEHSVWTTASPPV